jgi:putative polyhydroxyalkanoate system protein
MSEVRVSVPHSLPIPTAIEKVKAFEEMMAKFGVSSEWNGTTAKLKGAAASGSIEMTDSAAIIVVKLGLFAKAAGVEPERLAGSIKKRLEAAFAS